MCSYSNFHLRDLLDAFASTSPAPGGGSAAALSGPAGSSLLLMAVGIRRSRPAGAAESRDLADVADRLRSLQPTMAALIDRDAEAYSSVIAARRPPAPDDESKIRRRAAFEAAMRAATEVPLETMRACRRALREAPFIAAQITRSTRGDVGVAIELLRAPARRAGLTLDANLGALEDMEDAASVRHR